MAEEKEKNENKMMVSEETYMTSGVHIGTRQKVRYQRVHIQSTKRWIIHNRCKENR